MKKKGISSQIQIKIGKTVGIIFIVVAVIVGLVATNSITESPALTRFYAAKPTK